MFLTSSKTCRQPFGNLLAKGMTTFHQPFEPNRFWQPLGKAYGNPSAAVWQRFGFLLAIFGPPLGNLWTVVLLEKPWRKPCGKLVAGKHGYLRCLPPQLPPSLPRRTPKMACTNIRSRNAYIATCVTVFFVFSLFRFVFLVFSSSKSSSVFVILSSVGFFFRFFFFVHRKYVCVITDGRSGGNEATGEKSSRGGRPAVRRFCPLQLGAIIPRRA